MELSVLAKSITPLVDLATAAKITGIPSWMLRKDVRMRKLACHRRGGSRGKMRFSVADLSAYLERQRFAAAGDQ